MQKQTKLIKAYKKTYVETLACTVELKMDHIHGSCLIFFYFWRPEMKSGGSCLNNQRWTCWLLFWVFIYLLFCAQSNGWFWDLFKSLSRLILCHFFFLKALERIFGSHHSLQQSGTNQTKCLRFRQEKSPSTCKLHEDRVYGPWSKPRTFLLEHSSASQWTIISYYHWCHKGVED